MRRAVTPALLLSAAALAVGCGNPPTDAADTRAPDPPAGTRVVRIPKAGVRFTAPFNWPSLEGQGLRVGGLQNKTATVAIWRYPRSEPLPKTAAALREVRGLLLKRVKVRDRTFELGSVSYPRRDGARSIELVGRQTIGGLAVGVRSAHVYFGGAEIVIDAYAPPEFFPRVDQTVFEPLLKTLKLSEPKA